MPADAGRPAGRWPRQRWPDRRRSQATQVRRHRARPPSTPRRHTHRREDDDALDLGATVLPVLAKAYWKQALGVLLVLFVLRRLLRRVAGQTLAARLRSARP